MSDIQACGTRPVLEAASELDLLHRAQRVFASFLQSCDNSPVLAPYAGNAR
jgi:hypothetical protein